GEDVVDVRLHRRVADDEGGGDFGVRQAGGDQLEDVHLASGQIVGEGSGLRMTNGFGADDGRDEPLLDDRVEVGTSGGECSDRLLDLFGARVFGQIAACAGLKRGEQ